MMMTFKAQLTILALATTAAVLPALPAQQTVAPDAGCVQHKGSYTCNWSSFKLAFDRAHTVAVETGPMDRSSARQAGTLITELGKTHVPEGQLADLTILIQPTDASGMNIGPADHDLATLRVYAPSQGTARGVLLWAETYRGQGDRPWPAQVHALITQFEDRFPKR